MHLCQRVSFIAQVTIMKQISKSNYKSDKLYPSVVRAINSILERSLFVAPVDVLIASDRLDKILFEDWRFG